jgi:flavin-dependent dehydrogenase
VSAIDVLVVGAGPAGATAACLLARAGARVVVCDRARFPRDKLCGDTLNPGTLALLDRLGVGAIVRKRALAVTGMTVTGPGGVTVTADYPGDLRGAAMLRAELDLLLVEAAARAGAQIETGVSVRVPLFDATTSRLTGVGLSSADRTERALRARIVIAADGRCSTLAFKLGLARFALAPKRWAFGAYFTDVASLTERGEMHIRKDCYIGVAPLPDQVVNVCVVREVSAIRKTLCKRSPGDTDLLGDAVTGDPNLQERFAAARQVSRITVLGPLAVESRAPGCPGLLLAGDAAGFIDPITGDGLRFAVRGGELAAEAALRELESGTPAFKTLAAARAKEFGSKWLVNRAIRRVVGCPGAVALAARSTAHWGAPIRFLIDLAGDVGTARACATLEAR